MVSKFLGKEMTIWLKGLGHHEYAWIIDMHTELDNCTYNVESVNSFLFFYKKVPRDEHNSEIKENRSIETQVQLV